MVSISTISDRRQAAPELFGPASERLALGGNRRQLRNFGRLCVAIAVLALADVQVMAGGYAAYSHAGLSLVAATEAQEPRQGAPFSGGREGDRGFRSAERMLAAAVDLEGNRRNYMGRVVGRPQSVSCVEPQRCTYQRHFAISIAGKTRLVLFFSLNRSALGVVDCNEASPGEACEISASVFDVGDEMSPHCVRVAPVRRAAARHGWRVAPYLELPIRNVTRYSRSDDNRFRLFIRTLSDDECLRSIYIIRSVAA